MRVMIYHNTKDQADEKRLMPLVDALASGFVNRDDEVKALRSDKYEGIDPWVQMAVVIGLTDKHIWKDYMRASKHVLLVDEGYINPKKYWRFALDGFQSRHMYYGTNTKDHDRLDKLLAEEKIRLKSPPKDLHQRNMALYIGMSQAYCDWHRLGQDSEFDSGVTRQINTKDYAGSSKHNAIWYYKWPRVGRKICLPRRTELFKPDQHNLMELLDQSRALVTHGSRMAITALTRGIPVVLCSEMGVSPVFPAAGTKLEEVYTSRPPPDHIRKHVLSAIAWSQFTLKEIASGFAQATLEPYTVKRIKQYANLDDPQHLIEQYRLMHDMGKYRGGLEDDIVDITRNLVKVYKAKTLLDYGSGKGRQYMGELKQHEAWGILPHCYDPGFAEFANKPQGQFDGVICTDVAEHIPTANVENFLTNVLSYARNFVVFQIDTHPANKSLPDGRNCHLTIKPPEWWLSEIATAMNGDLPTFTKLAENLFRIEREGSTINEIIVVFR